MNFVTLLPLLIQGATALAPLIGALSPTVAAKIPAAASAATAASHPDPVTFIQQLLGSAGHPVTVDGVLGPQTIGAVDTWAEQQLGIVPGGLLSIGLRESLQKLVPAPAASAA